MYTYCANNPVIYVDPSGHIAVIDDAAAATVAFLAIEAACLIGSVLSQPQVQKGLSQAANALTRGISSALDSVSTGLHDFFVSSGSSHGLMDTFSSTVNDPYLDPWIDDSLTIEENWAKNWQRADVKTDSKPISDVISKTKDIVQKNSTGYTVYKLVDKDDSVQYIGRTGDVDATIRRHRNNIFRTELDLVPIHQGLSYEESRGLEQHYIEYYQTINKANKMNNQINGVNPKNTEMYNYYADIAKHYLMGETYVGG